MALLAEEIVEEWLNRQGFFTIRGIKLGVHEIDILAMKLGEDGPICRHLEVQASIRPISYLCSLAKSLQKSTGRAPMSAKQRTKEELKLSVREWVQKKYHLDRKRALRESLYPGNWSFELVVHKLRHSEELEYINKEGIVVHKLSDVVDDLSKSNFTIKSAAGADLVDLIMLE